MDQDFNINKFYSDHLQNCYYRNKRLNTNDSESSCSFCALELPLILAGKIKESSEIINNNKSAFVKDPLKYTAVENEYNKNKGIKTRIFLPTEEQLAIIEPSNEEINNQEMNPLLVIAGAGSGKTQTMTDKMIFLIANQIVSPQEILGLTFTNKAVSELKERVDKNLFLFRSGLSDKQQKILDKNSYINHQFENPSLKKYFKAIPNILTYNSFASTIISQFGTSVGIPTNVKVITDAMKQVIIQDVLNEQIWQLLKKFADQKKMPVHESVGEFYDDLLGGKSNLTLLNSVVRLADELGNNLKTTSEVKDYLRRVCNFQIDSSNISVDTQKILSVLNVQQILMDFVESYINKKLSLNPQVMEFSDQVEKALYIINRDSKNVEDIRSQYKIVILDEYQDTSPSQAELIQKIFGNGFPVMAVGDPNQAIYGFRGASSSGLMNFPYICTNRDGSPAKILSLTISWRNSPEVLMVANKVIAPFTRQSIDSQIPDNKIELKNLRENPFWTDDEQQVFAKFYSFDTIEAEETARYLKNKFWDWNNSSDNKNKKRTAAILFRARADFNLYANELEKLGIPFEIVGLGGLLETPEIMDILALLKITVDHGKSNELMRLISGQHFMIGIKDIDILGRYAKNKKISLYQAVLDYTVAIEKKNKNIKISDTAKSRVLELSKLLKRVDELKSLSLSELIILTSKLLFLDIETDGKNINTFVKVANDYSESVSQPTLRNFLNYLEVADSAENGMDMPIEPVNKEAVQLITIHGSKGLEWDIVCSVGNSIKRFYNALDKRKSWNKILDISITDDEVLDFMMNHAVAVPVIDRGKDKFKYQIVDNGVAITDVSGIAKKTEEEAIEQVSKSVPKKVFDPVREYLLLPRVNNLQIVDKSNGEPIKITNYKVNSPYHLDSLIYNARLDYTSLPQFDPLVNFFGDPDFGIYKKELYRHYLDEERRLAYVAWTRAKNFLQISGSWNSRNGQPTKAVVFGSDDKQVIFDRIPNDFPTPFFIEVYKELFDQNTPIEKRAKQMNVPSCEEIENHNNGDTEIIYFQQEENMSEKIRNIRQLANEVENQSQELEEQIASCGSVETFVNQKIQSEKNNSEKWQKLKDLYLHKRLLELKNSNYKQLIKNDSLLNSSQVNEILHNTTTTIAPTGLVQLKKNAKDYLLDLLRPLPQKQEEYFTLGTNLHNWIQQIINEKNNQNSLPNNNPEQDSEQDIEEDSSKDSRENEKEYQKETPEEKLEFLQKRFKESIFYTNIDQALAAEEQIEFFDPETKLLVRSRIDAVFQDGDWLKETGHNPIENGVVIIDWKTWSVLPSQKDLEIQKIQLEYYKIGYHALHPDIAKEKISIAFYSIKQNKLIWM
ncbi:MAG: UvrD-helicase domain-containing protein [Candidatus Ancillula sp.]|jgi:superfamily I DNA/RNA helicase|nr:UvrD-helicase domain-containing protein [Candidatus Ancillula sp.]